jgi:carbonyl reductase 1
MTSPGGQLIVAVRPGLVDTRASRPWLTGMSAAQSPDQAAADIVRLATGPVAREIDGELVQQGHILPCGRHPRLRRRDEMR